jgi:hypothetical protein
VANFAVQDDHDVRNALLRGPAVPATVSFDIRWTGTGRNRLRDAALGFDLLYRDATATIEWSARQAGFEFVSDPASTSTNFFSIIGVERNGVFFGPESVWFPSPFAF